MATVIVSHNEIALGLKSLLEADTRLVEIIDQAGDIPLRLRPAGLESLCQIVVSQQVSVASAAAIWGRVQPLIEPFDETTLAATSDEQLGIAGLSRPKIRTIRAIQNALKNGLDLEKIATIPAEDAHAALCCIKGIGRWSADIYLLFCAGHPDIFPSGDVALQHAVHQGFKLNDRPDVKTLDHIAERWAPWRGVAARVFWAYYRTIKQGRETLPV
ncbi:MAG: DNA-3-methyladenine glycosylase 2 family protein [Stappiaceae bacterium]